MRKKNFKNREQVRIAVESVRGGAKCLRRMEYFGALRSTNVILHHAKSHIRRRRDSSR